MSDGLAFVLNGEEQRVRGIDPNTTLLTFLRSLGHTGTKEACAEGECGACAVNLVSPAESPRGRGRFETVNSCLVLLPEIAGREVWTVEGVARGTELHPVQAAMVEAGGSQCGYCTPGFVMSLVSYYYADPRPDVRTALSGNLCRCTGYRPILEAAGTLSAPEPDDPLAARLAGTSSGHSDVRSGSEGLSYAIGSLRFDRPATLAEALELRRAHPSATLVAGGTDVVVGLNQDGTRREHWIALGAVPELRAISVRDDRVRIGAGVTWSALESAPVAEQPMIRELIRVFASPLVRSRATLGGNLMTASPVGDGAPVLLALDAEAELASVSGSRTVPLADFFTDYRRTAIRADELLVAVSIPLEPPTVSRFYKVGKRELDDISSVSAALALWIEAGRVTRARFAFGGVAATPVRAPRAELALVGRAPDADGLRDVLGELQGAFSPIDDVRASAAYRAAMISSLMEKFWAEAVR